MCEIEFLYALGEGKITDNEIKGIGRMLAGGANANDDGFGMFNESGIYFKKPEKFEYNEANLKMMTDTYVGSQFLVAHARFGTLGTNMEGNTHPVISGDVLLVHNGIIRNDDELRKKYKIPEKPKVDSYVIAWLLNKEMEKNPDIGTAVKNVCKELEGTYSVFFYHVERQRLFYFRHVSDFNWALMKNAGKYYVVGSTANTRIESMFLKQLFGFICNASEILTKETPKSEVLYEFTSKGIVIVEKDLPTNYSTTPITEYGNCRPNYFRGQARKVPVDDEIIDFIRKNGQRFEVEECPTGSIEGREYKNNDKPCEYSRPDNKGTSGRGKGETISRKGEAIEKRTNPKAEGCLIDDNMVEEELDFAVTREIMLDEIKAWLLEKYPASMFTLTDDGYVLIESKAFVLRHNDRCFEVGMDYENGVIDLKTLELIMFEENGWVKSGYKDLSERYG